MIRIKITRRWKRPIGSKNSGAVTNIGTLWCKDVFWSERVPSWVGQARIGLFIRNGSIRRSESKARQDAEKLAIELLRDIRDGAKELISKCGMGDDD